MKTPRLAPRLIGPALIGGLLVGLPAGPAFAADPPPSTETAGPLVSTSLPVFGVGITLNVTTDAAGHLTEVAVTGAGSDSPPTDVVATEVGPHEVKLVNTATGAEVEIETGTHKISTKMESDELAALVGDHTWSGDLFGTGPVDVLFSIGDAGGTPTIDVTGVGGGFAYTTETEVERDSDDDEVEVEVKIQIAGPDGTVALVKVEVEVEVEHGGTEAELKISARSELLATSEHEGDADDPSVNVPVDSDHHHDEDDHGDDHDDDHEDDDDDDHHDHDDDDDEDEDDHHDRDHDDDD